MSAPTPFGGAEPTAPLHFAATADGLIPGLTTATIAILGFAVGYVAYRGYRRNESLPMLFVAAGFLVAFWTPGVLFGGFAALDAVATFAPGLRSTVRTALALAADLATIVGLCCILYGLWMPRR
ncbi:DUF7521 family protein [Halosimplex pelagicum]|uniref:Uncharacterized protein n=1 Tax=Halosimplex pelagicum TaxID=869886 RepID=A0A7D5TC76_9EURY|nr:hypothetical protein [Halosimplex pelagicum]QLH82709.1 hypothetical protein HZS54_14235 [Halosimplex pelagicum]